MKKYLKKYYPEIILLTIIILFSLFNIYKAPLLKKEYENYFIKQLIWIIISILISIFILKIKFKFIFKIRYILYFFNIILLIIPLIFCKSINGVHAWIKFGSLSFQPSELTKITFPLVSIYLIKHKKYFVNSVLFLIPFILILIEPDTGNALFLFLIYLFLMINKNNIKYFKIITIILILIITATIFLFKYKNTLLINIFNGALYYRFKRIFEFKNNLQIENALVSISNAKLFPLPINKNIIYIPEGITDFIFSFSIPNLGIILSFLLIIIYFLFIYKIIKRINKHQYYYKKKITYTFIFIFIIQFIYNIFMNIGIFPIMGIPLPFYSYGGSNIITYFILYILTAKKISSIEDKGNNNYKNNYHKVLVDKSSLDKLQLHKQV